MNIPLQKYYQQVPRALVWAHAELAVSNVRLWFLTRAMVRSNRRLTASAEIVLNEFEDLSAAQIIAFWTSLRSVVEWVQGSGIKDLEPLIPRMKAVLDAAEDVLQHGYGMDTHGPLELMLSQAYESDEAWKNRSREDRGMGLAIEEALNDPDLDPELAQRIRAAR